MKGLADQTEPIFRAVSELPCIREYTIIGGTALALQINHRKSEDLDFDQVNFIVSGVKVSFITKQQYTSPVKKPVAILNNIIAANLEAIGAMKIELMLRRSEFRDYYDIYSILQEGISLKSIVALAAKYSNHRLMARNALAHLANGAHYRKEKGFALLEPVYDVDVKGIEKYLQGLIAKEYRFD